jgi:NAD(P)-dependent dehydrogenase (short-subunit alcohol dehydrogenase family)
MICPIAIVTGGARRIGRAIAEDLAGHGWTVAIHYNYSKIDADEVVGQIRDGGGQAAAVAADFATAGAGQRLVATVVETLGKPSLLVNNASMFARDLLDDLDEVQFDRQMAVNCKVPIFTSQAFAAALAEGVDGNIVNIVDQRVLRPTPRLFSYHLSKAALWAATQTMAQALAPRIRVNAIGPGPSVKNELQTDTKFQQQTESVMLGRGPELAEFGRTVRFLVENRSITGEMITLDGGQHLAWETPDNADFDE